MSAYLRNVLFWLFLLVIFVVFHFALIQRGRAHDHDPSHDAWYRGLKQQDVPTMSCCALADAYWCDEYYARNGKAYCRITDDQDDDQLGRPHIDIGTEIEIPPNKLKYEQDGQPTGNPTGHSVVFLSRQRYVYCFVQSGGV